MATRTITRQIQTPVTHTRTITESGTNELGETTTTTRTDEYVVIETRTETHVIQVPGSVPLNAQLEADPQLDPGVTSLDLNASTTGQTGPLTDEEIETLAKEVLGVGARTGFDDYDARLEHLAETMADLDPDSATRLMAEIYEQDPSASAYWLDVQSLGELTAKGRVDAEGQAAIANAFAEAYVSGTISEDQAVSFFSGYLGDLPPAADAGWLQPIADFVAAGGPSMQAFVDTFASDIIERFSSQGAVNFAFHLADLGGSTSPALLFESLPEERQVEVLDALADYGQAFMARGVADPYAAVISSIAEHGSAESAVMVAAHAVSTAKTNPFAMFDMYDNSAFAERSDALSQLVTSDTVGRAVLEAFANNNISFNIGSNDTVAETQGTALAMLMRLTALSGNDGAADAMNALESYVRDLQSNLNTNPTDADFYALSIIGVAAREAVDQLFDEAASRQASREALVDFIVDVGLAALPLGSMADDAVSAAIGELFGDRNGPVRRALDHISGEIVDSATGMLTDEARQAIYGALSEDAAEIVDTQDLVNGFVQSLLVGIDDFDRRSNLSNRIESLSFDLRQ